MPSTYSGFDLLLDNGDGTVTPIGNQTVNFYDLTNNVLLATTALSDADGHVASGSLNINPGTVIRYWFVTGAGICAFEETTTF